MRRYGIAPHRDTFPPIRTAMINAVNSTHLKSLLTLQTGSDPSRPTLVAIKGVVFDVTRNSAYGQSGQYRGKCSVLDFVVASIRTVH
jgi:hypothetical protein